MDNKSEEETTMATLRELVDEFGANGVIMIDAGNGCAGPAWIEWDEEIDAELGDVEMLPVTTDAPAYEDDENEDTILDVAKYVIRDYSTDGEMYASEWIEDDNRGGSNPYRFRLVF